MNVKWQGLIRRVITFCVFLCSYALANATDHPTKLLITTSALTEREALLHVAQDQGFFRKQGLNVQLVQVRSGPLAVAALSAGESHLHWGSVTSANLGAIAAGADLVFVAGFINRLTGTLVVTPQIKTPSDLKGKTLGVNTISGGGGVFTSLALEHWQLIPERDKIQFRTLGGDQSVIAQHMTRGGVDGAYFSYTYGKIMQAKGFYVLADLEKLGIPYQGSGIICRRAFAMAAPDTVENILRSLIDSANFIRNSDNKHSVLKSLAKGIRLARPEDAEEAYLNTLNLYEKRPYPSIAGIRNAIRVIGSSHPALRRLRAEDLVVDRFVKQLEQNGRL